MGMSSIEASSLSASIIGTQQPLSKGRMSALAKLGAAAASVVLAAVGFGWVFISEPLYDSESVYVVGTTSDDGDYVERSFNLLGKLKRESHLNVNGEETVRFHTIGKLGDPVGYEEYQNGEFRGLASADYLNVNQMIEDLRDVVSAHGEGCWIYKLSDDGRGVAEASLRLDGEDNGNFSYRYVTYDNLGRSTTLTIVNEMGSAIGEVLEYEFDGASGVVTAIDYRNADTGELSQRAQYERREDGKTEKIHWYLPSGDEFAIAYYDENEKFLGWDDSF